MLFAHCLAVETPLAYFYVEKKISISKVFLDIVFSFKSCFTTHCGNAQAGGFPVQTLESAFGASPLLSPSATLPTFSHCPCWLQLTSSLSTVFQTGHLKQMAYLMLRPAAWGVCFICILSQYRKENAIAPSLGQSRDDLHFHLCL